MNRLKNWVDQNYPASLRDKFANNKDECLFFTGCFYSKFKSDAIGGIWGYVCEEGA